MTTENTGWVPPGALIDSTLAEAVRDHHKFIQSAQARLWKLRDRKIELELELAHLAGQMAQAERDVEGAKEMLAMSWSHYRSHVEKP